MLTNEEIELIARFIAADLFTNGQGERAARLVLESPSAPGQAVHGLGGWSERAVAHRIASKIRFALALKGKEE